MTRPDVSKVFKRRVTPLQVWLVEGTGGYWDSSYNWIDSVWTSEEAAQAAADRRNRYRSDESYEVLSEPLTLNGGS